MQTVAEHGTCVTDVLRSLSLMLYSDIEFSAALCLKMSLLYELPTSAVEDTTLACKVSLHVPNDAVTVQDKRNALYSI
jgi:hypothetical protein